MKKGIFVLLAVVISLSTFSQKNHIKAFEYLKNRGEVYFQFSINSVEDLSDLSRVISIDHVSAFHVRAYANHKEFIKFLAYGLSFEVLSPPSMLIEQEMYDGAKGIWDFDTYPIYSEYETMMYQFQTNYPDLCKIHEVGTTNEGRKLLIAQISDNVNVRENEGRFMYSSSMHGDETTGYVLMLHLIDYLLSNYGSDAEVNSLVENLEIWIMPLENPDGTYAGGDNTVFGSTRSNAMNVDLNRNYKNHVDGDHPDGEAWQTETQAMMSFFDTIHFVMSANIHGGAELLNYPWDSWYSTTNAHADHDWWEYVSVEYATNAQNNSPSGYMEVDYDGNGSTGVTHGADWYLVTGSRQDYFNYYNRCREFTLEISNTKTLDEADLLSLWDYNKQAFLDYIKQSMYGFHGIVTDSITHEPLVANVFIDGHDKDNSDVYSELPIGDYHRPILEGTYMVTYSSTGYRSKTLEVIVTNGMTTVLDVELANLEFVPPLANFEADQTNLTCQGEVQFTNLSESFGATDYLWDFGDGSTSADENPIHTYTENGLYSVTLTATNTNGTDEKVITSYISVDLPQVTSVVSAAVCDTEGSMELSATGEGTIFWFDAASGGTLLGTGDTYSTPVLTSSTTYYVEDHTGPSTDYVGKTDNSGSGGYYDNNSEWGLVFDSYQASTLKSVLVYTGSAGNRTIYLKNSTGSTLDEITVNIPSGESRVDLNFTLPIGNDLQLTCSSNPDMFRNNNGDASYPYELPGVLSITKSNLPDMYGPEDYYYFFYDWEIEGEECVSERVPVFAVINESPEANFTYSTMSAATILFDNSSLSAVSYLWDFGDATGTSTEINPSYTYTANGTYTVTLIAENDCGSDTITQEISITDVGVGELNAVPFLMYPNPVNDILTINFSENNNSYIQIIDVTGRVLFDELNTSNILEISVSNWNRGVYYVRVRTGNTVYIEEFIKL